MDRSQRIKKLREYQDTLEKWLILGQIFDVRSEVLKDLVWVKNEVSNANCFKKFTFKTESATINDVDAFDAMIDLPKGLDRGVVVRKVMDMILQTIGAIECEDEIRPKATTENSGCGIVDKNYAFVVMPMDREDPQLVDVLQSIKEAAKQCGIAAERVDEPHYSERITDRILISIKKANFVIVDLTHSKPNVFYEAGYAQGLDKKTIYVAREGTNPEFDIKDYPIIFFRNMKELKDQLEARLTGLKAS